MWRRSDIFLLFAIFAAVAGNVFAEVPKREFRGAWLHTVYQDGYAKRSTAENKQWLSRQLDALQEAGINAVIFQVRPSADAFYDSPYEPWSRFLTLNGKAPDPYWDPLEYMVEQCHARGMELHAWLNPYRATTSAKAVIPQGHICHSHPERFIRFDKKLYLDPGIPENRELIEKIVVDIVRRYDVDGIHFDDYFYPYPVKGQRFNDDKSYQRYGKGMKLSDWRRSNVDLLIENLHKAIRKTKPWVRFGVSPFGIWRNRSTDPAGSASNGLQNYDDLYADVLKWAREGWIDYQMPQLYWTLENKVAPSMHLAQWWSDNSYGRHVYVGQDVDRTMQ
ncbi:MAG: family 10 glycosylhydrolase, partial [Muribaculaceae bacterium]|nr:family 10 glycosylhydrolase [Muribaculaceae bacterium]